MDNFTHLFTQYTNGEYDWLRVKSVDANTQSGTMTVYMYVREDRYDNFDNHVIEMLQGFFRLFVKRYKLKFQFEPMTVSSDIVRNYVTEYLSVHYPFVAANIFLDKVKVTVKGEQILCVLPIPTGIEQYARDSHLTAEVAKEVTEYFMMPCEVRTEHTDAVVEVGQQDLRSHISNVIEVEDVHYVCGRKITAYQAPVMMSSVYKECDRLTLCGEVTDVKEYAFTPEEMEKNKGKKYRYTLTLNDHTGSMKVYFKTKEDACPLKKASGQYLVVGRVFYSDRTQTYGMSAYSVFSCNINFAKIEDANKPLPVPSTYRYAPLPVDTRVTMTQDNFLEDATAPKWVLGTQVFLYLRCMSDGSQPYQLCALKVTDGKPVEKYTSYVYMQDTSNVEVMLKNLVAAAPRIADLVPDLVKFCHRGLVVTLHLAKTQEYLVKTAANLRYAFECDWYDADLLLKKGKVVQPFHTVLSANKIDLRSPDAEDCALALYELYEQKMAR